MGAKSNMANVNVWVNSGRVRSKSRSTLSPVLHIHIAELRFKAFLSQPSNFTTGYFFSAQFKKIKTLAMERSERKEGSEL